MAQRLRLDRRRGPLYVGLLAAAACRVPPAPLVPEAARPVERGQVAAWVAATVPDGGRLHRFKWLFRDERSSAGGRGSARVAPPDSLRFDVAGPFGSGPASAVVVGGSPVWIEPPDALDRVVPSYPLMWAMFGVARPPEPGAALRGLERGGVTAWQYARGADTVEYVRTEGQPSRLVAELRRRGEVVGRAETTLGPGWVPLTARLTVPSVPARLDLTFSSTEPRSFGPEIWLPHRP